MTRFGRYTVHASVAAILLAYGAVALGQPADKGPQRDGGPGRPAALKSQLTDAQRTQLKALRDQLQSGAITREQFRAQAKEILGDLPLPPNGPAGRGFGGEGRFGPAEHLLRAAQQLDLTDAQKTQLKALMDQLHQDVKSQREAAVASALERLTPEQHAIVEKFKADHPGPGVARQMNAVAGSAENAIATAKGDASTAKAESAAPAHPDAPPPFLGGPRGGRHGQKGEVDAGPGQAPLIPPPIMSRLNLTDEQKAALKDVRDNFQTALKSRIEQAQADFKALLTADQAAMLETLRARRPAPQGAAPAAPTDK